MIIKDFYANAAGEVKINGPTQIESSGYAAIVIVKIIPCGKGIADLRNKLNRGLCKGIGRRKYNNG
jgi:hypothetical protein